MIRFFENYSLKTHNTFNVEAKAKYFFEFTDPADLGVFLNSNRTWKDEKLLVLGGGSNMLFVNDFDGLIICPNVPGVREIAEDRQNVWVEVGSGENWDDFVQYAVVMKLGGIENLSLIPGTVGAAPIQNIGAYGQEVSNVIETVKGFDLETQLTFEFNRKSCDFSYRNSIFKQSFKNRAIITSVIFKLEKFPEFNLNYGQVEVKVKARGETNLLNVRDTIIEIRSSKLPDVKELGNAGSFFKNPVVEVGVAEQLQKQFDKVPVYTAENGNVKLAAGWLIENAGWRGVQEGDVGVHEKQALVLVNYGSATGKEIFDFSEKIKKSVFEKFGIELEREVNCI
jgi:UDP-N-acetylmuramate dehydrogenase